MEVLQQSIGSARRAPGKAELRHAIDRPVTSHLVKALVLAGALSGAFVQPLAGSLVGAVGGFFAAALTAAFVMGNLAATGRRAADPLAFQTEARWPGAAMAVIVTIPVVMIINLTAAALWPHLWIPLVGLAFTIPLVAAMAGAHGAEAGVHQLPQLRGLAAARLRYPLWAVLVAAVINGALWRLVHWEFQL